jgi:hypothetical protein
MGDSPAIINMDETAWRIVNGKIKTIAKQGQGKIPGTGVDPKTCLTVIAAVSADGRKLPLWVVCRGKTPGCMTKFSSVPVLNDAIKNKKKLCLTFSPTGWVTKDVAKQYLQWLRQTWKRGGRICLYWDVYASHRCQEVKDEAAEQAIELEFIPGGGTGDWQPLDRLVFGALKRKATALFDSASAKPIGLPDSPKFDMKWALQILLDSWDALRPDTIRKSWAPLK